MLAMDFATATYLLFGAALAAGWIAYRRSSSLGDQLPTWLREATRCNMALCVSLGTWAVKSFALWAAGAALKVVAITEGRMHHAWWLGPVALAWATWCYVELKRKTTTR